MPTAFIQSTDGNTLIPARFLRGVRINDYHQVSVLFSDDWPRIDAGPFPDRETALEVMAEFTREVNIAERDGGVVIIPTTSSWNVGPLAVYELPAI